MAVATYATDLTDITLAESTTSWNALGGGASGLDQNADSSMQGTYGVGKQISAAEKGQVYGLASHTIPSNMHTYIWIFMTTPGLCNSLINRGVCAVVGPSATVYTQYHVEGNDTYGASGRVGKCYPIDTHVYSSNPSTPPYRTTVGTPGGATQYWGATANTTASVKGFNLVVDAIRYGTGVFAYGGTSTDPDANFADLATKNDANDGTAGYNRWGVFSKVGGAYEVQGFVYIGKNSSDVDQATDFTDSNKTLFFLENPHVQSTFNGIEIAGSTTVVTLNNMTFQNLGDTSRARITRKFATNPTYYIDSCNFINMGDISIGGSSTIEVTDCIFRECDLLSIGGTITGCTIVNSHAPTYAMSRSYTAFSTVTKNTFISSGTGHAVYLGTVTATASMDWDNFLSGYAVSDGSTGNEAIRVNVSSGQTLTINVAAGADTPSIYNIGTGTVVVVSGAVSVKAKAITDTGTAVSGARIFLEANSGGGLPSYASVTIANSGTLATVTHSTHNMLTGDKVCIRGASLDANNGVFTITKIDANSYSYTMGSSPGSSPTGTITSTYVAIADVSDGTGYNTTPVSRTYAIAQPVVGRIRKSSSAPFYKNASLSGTISTSAGLDIAGVLISDD